MAVILKNYYQDKPPLGSQINWGHPLSQGLVGCWLMNEVGGNYIYNLYNCNKSTSWGTRVSSGWNFQWQKMGILCNTNRGYYPELIGSYRASRDLSMVIKFQPTAAPLSTHHAIYNSCERTAEGSGGLFLRIQTDSTYHFLKSAVVDIGNGTLKTAYAVGTQYTLGFTINNNGNYVLYDKGISIKSANTSNTFTLGSPVLGMEGTSTGDACSGIFHFCYIFKRALSPNEIKELYQAPYQFIQPIRRRFYSIGGVPTILPNEVTQLIMVN